MRELTAEKRRIINEHYNNLMDAYGKMEEATDRAMKDTRTVGKGNVSIFNVFKTGAAVIRNKSTELDSEQKAQYAKLEFQRSGEVFEEIKYVLKSGSDSLIEDIQVQMGICQKEIASIDKELESTPDDEKTKHQ